MRIAAAASIVGPQTHESPYLIFSHRIGLRETHVAGCGVAARENEGRNVVHCFFERLRA
jgi:hypothetical protein